MNIEIQQIRRVFYAFTLFVLAIAYYDNLLLHQLQTPILIHPHADNTYWLFHYLGIPQFLVSSFTISLIFDLVLIGSAALSLFSLENKYYPRFFFISFLTYFITYNTYLTHHSHGYTGILLMSGIFCFNSPKTFSDLFAMLRYYTLFIFVSAAFWKIGRGSVFNPDQMFEILKAQHLYELVHNPGSFFTSIVYWLIDHKAIAQLLFVTGCLLQLSFLVGFFTRKYDKVLFVLFFVFFIGDYLIMDLGFYKLYILSITLLVWEEMTENKEPESNQILTS